MQVMTFLAEKSPRFSLQMKTTIPFTNESGWLPQPHCGNLHGAAPVTDCFLL